MPVTAIGSNLEAVPGNVAVRALSGNLTLSAGDKPVQMLDAGAADRDVTLPAVEAGLTFTIWNIGAANSLVVKNPAGTSIVTVPPGFRASVWSSHSSWDTLTHTQSSDGTVDMEGAAIVGLPAASVASGAATVGQLLQRYIGVGSGSLGHSSTRYVSPGGVRVESGEGNAQAKMYTQGGVLRNFRIYVSGNTMSGGTVLTLRKNGADTAITMSLASGTVGAQEDTTHEVSFSAGDLICLKIVTTGSGLDTFAFTSWQIDAWGI